MGTVLDNFSVFKNNYSFCKSGDAYAMGNENYRFIFGKLNVLFRTGLPVKEWTAERGRLTAGRFSLCGEYYRLKDETRSVEHLRKGAENIMWEDARRIQPSRAHGIDL